MAFKEDSAISKLLVDILIYCLEVVLVITCFRSLKLPCEETVDLLETFALVSCHVKGQRVVLCFFF